MFIFSFVRNKILPNRSILNIMISVRTISDTVLNDLLMVYRCIRPLSRDWGTRNSVETLQSGYAPRSGPEIKDERSSAKDSAPERPRCGIPEEVVRSCS